jgi:hypothetical protein
MAVGAEYRALVQLALQGCEADPAVARVGNGELLLRAVAVVEVHDVRRELGTAVGAGAALELVDRGSERRPMSALSRSLKVAAVGGAGVRAPSLALAGAAPTAASGSVAWVGAKLIKG